jgi:hypothetical protein
MANGLDYRELAAAALRRRPPPHREQHADRGNAGRNGRRDDVPAGRLDMQGVVARSRIRGTLRHVPILGRISAPAPSGSR